MFRRLEKKLGLFYRERVTLKGMKLIRNKLNFVIILFYLHTDLPYYCELQLGKL